MPYIKALYDDFSGDRSALAEVLTDLPDSFAGRYFLDREKYGVTLPIELDRPVLTGVLGKEKPLCLSLTARQLAIILGLAAHLRGFEFALIEENVVFHPYGWIELTGQSAIQSELISLAARLNGSELPIENHRDVLFRLSIKPECVFFDERLFAFSVRQADMQSTQTKIPVILNRKAFDTALGSVKDKAEEFKLTLEFAHKLESLSMHQFSTDHEEAVKIEDTYKKGLHKEPLFLALGLRNLIRRDAGVFKFVVRYEST